MVWKPHVTVAAIAERDGRFLLIEEEIKGRRVLNQPAGHLERGETLPAAVARETLEESGHRFRPAGVTGLYRWTTPTRKTYLRVCFHGTVSDYDPARPLDQGIVGPLWLSREEVAERAPHLRSPMVLRCIDDYLAGCHYPLGLLVELVNEPPC